MNNRICAGCVLALSALAGVAIAPPAAAEAPIAPKVVVIAHRGASALRPEHTLAAYAKAIADGADFIEPDLVITRDGQLVARHENEISTTTDVAEHPEFARRKRTKRIDGQTVTGWFTEDFSLAELKTLRACERLPSLRGRRYDGMFQIPSLDEIIDFAAAESITYARPVGIMPEIKHSSHFRRLGLPLEDRLLAILAAHAYTRQAPVEIQSFEVANLRYLRRRLGPRGGRVRLLQLLDVPTARPADTAAHGGKLSYGQMMQPAGLREVAGYADAIGPSIREIIPLRAGGYLGQRTSLVRDAHRVGLAVQPYTFRPENPFIAKDFWRGNDPKTFNPEGSVAEIRRYLATGLDGFFTDDPALGRAALQTH